MVSINTNITKEVDGTRVQVVHVNIGGHVTTGKPNDATFTQGITIIGHVHSAVHTIIVDKSPVRSLATSCGSREVSRHHIHTHVARQVGTSHRKVTSPTAARIIIIDVKRVGICRQRRREVNIIGCSNLFTVLITVQRSPGHDGCERVDIKSNRRSSGLLRSTIIGIVNRRAIGRTRNRHLLYRRIFTRFRREHRRLYRRSSSPSININIIRYST